MLRHRCGTNLYANHIGSNLSSQLITGFSQGCFVRRSRRRGRLGWYRRRPLLVLAGVNVSCTSLFQAGLGRRTGNRSITHIWRARAAARLGDVTTGMPRVSLWWCATRKDSYSRYFRCHLDFIMWNWAIQNNPGSSTACIININTANGLLRSAKWVQLSVSVPKYYLSPWTPKVSEIVVIA